MSTITNKMLNLLISSVSALVKRMHVSTSPRSALRVSYNIKITLTCRLYLRLRYLCCIFSKTKNDIAIFQTIKPMLRRGVLRSATIKEMFENSTRVTLFLQRIIVIRAMPTQPQKSRIIYTLMKNAQQNCVLVRMMDAMLRQEKISRLYCSSYVSQQ